MISLKEIPMLRSLMIFVFLTACMITMVPTGVPATSSSKVVVYYFHGQFRCYSCTRIEDLTRSALQNRFRRELTAKSVEWRPINVESPGNNAYIAKYRLRSRSVVISRVVNGSEREWKNLESVWNHYGNENAFRNYISREVNTYLTK
jgi:hypothetical protein